LPRGIVGPRHGRYVSFETFYVKGAAYDGLVGGAAEAARFVLLHLNCGAVNGARLLSAKPVAETGRMVPKGGKRDFGLNWFRPMRPSGAARLSSSTSAAAQGCSSANANVVARRFVGGSLELGPLALLSRSLPQRRRFAVLESVLDRPLEGHRPARRSRRGQAVRAELRLAPPGDRAARTKRLSDGRSSPLARRVSCTGKSSRTASCSVLASPACQPSPPGRERRLGCHAGGARVLRPFPQQDVRSPVVAARCCTCHYHSKSGARRR
jgi:hypothetical protein